MNIDNIITESINEFLAEDIFDEVKKKKTHKKKKYHKEKKSKDVKKKGKKLTNGRRGEFNVKYDRETNPNLTDADAEDLIDMVDTDVINLAAVAKKVYPDHTPQGAQSQLRKKIKGLRSDSGAKYRLKRKEGDKVLKALKQELF